MLFKVKFFVDWARRISVVHSVWVFGVGERLHSSSNCTHSSSIWWIRTSYIHLWRTTNTWRQTLRNATRIHVCFVVRRRPTPTAAAYVVFVAAWDRVRANLVRVGMLLMIFRRNRASSHKHLSLNFWRFAKGCPIGTQSHKLALLLGLRLIGQNELILEGLLHAHHAFFYFAHTHFSALLYCSQIRVSVFFSQLLPQFFLNWDSFGQVIISHGRIFICRVHHLLLLNPLRTTNTALLLVNNDVLLIFFLHLRVQILVNWGCQNGVFIWQNSSIRIRICCTLNRDLPFALLLLGIML